MPSVQAGQSGLCPFTLLLALALSGIDLALSGRVLPCLGEGIPKRVGMATGLGEGSCAPEPSHGLTPACLLGALSRGGGAGGTQGRSGFNASAVLCLSPSPVGRLNGTVGGSQWVAIQCLPASRLPGRGAHSRRKTGREMGPGSP